MIDKKAINWKSIASEAARYSFIFTLAALAIFILYFLVMRAGALPTLTIVAITGGAMGALIEYGRQRDD